MACSNTRYPGWDSPVCRGSKQALHPQKSLEEKWKCRCAAQRRRASLRSQILYECELAGCSSYTKNSGMNQILLQCRSITDPCPCGYAPIFMASVRAGWGGNRCLLGPPNFHFSLQRETTFLWAVCWGVPGGMQDD